MPRKRWLQFSGFGLAAALAAYLGACFGPYQRGGLEAVYPDGNLPKRLSKQVDGKRLHYATMPGNGGTPLFFIHGSPGDWQAWNHYLAEPAFDDFGPRLAVDRPGFGGSKTGGIVTDLRRQAQLLRQLLPPDRPAIVVAHSLGSPIAAWMAIDNPQSVCGVISIAGSLAPELEAMRWYNQIATWTVVQALIPKPLLESNREIQALQQQLVLLEQHWPQLQRPLFALQGMQDELVNPETANYLESAIDPQWLSVKRYPQQGHFVLWETPALVIEAITQMNDQYCQL